MDKYEVLKEYFGYDSFREGQEELNDSILEGQDVLGIMPTGAGKSICYQVPALCMDGITLVISPLISLMMDQVKALNQAGVHAAYINSSLTEGQISKALQNAGMGQYKIIYVAPERLETERFLEFALNAKISMVTVDEAHCISQWGQDFRPSYLKIVRFVEKLTRRPVLSAFTATATTVVKEDIVNILELQAPKVLITGFDRENLFFEVKYSKNKDEQLYHYLQNHLEESGIIYCATRKNVEKVCTFLQDRGLSVTRYHAGLSPEERKANQEDFIYDRKAIVVATNAFGMGIDKSNVRFVVHYNMPQSLENYYQEAGRAGRDGMSAECVILYSPQDVHINKFLIENRGENSELSEEQALIVQKNDEERLWAMSGYCKTKYCLREYILRYFGTSRRKDISGKYCGNCSNCVNATRSRDYEEYDYGGLWEDGYTQDDKLPFGGEYGEKISAGPKYGGYGNSRYDSVGRGSGIYGAGSYGTGMYGENNYAAGNTGISSEMLTAEEQELFKLLKAKRLEIAKTVGLPPYMIFTDKTLMDMAVKKPVNRENMLQVNGVGENKYRRYGDSFTNCISLFLKETD